MNQQTKLTLKYFTQQKFYEILLTVIIISAIIFIPYLLGHYIGDNKSSICDSNCGGFSEITCDENTQCNYIDNWFEGLFYIFILILLLIFLAIWLGNNWDKAKKRAKKELRRKK